MFSEYETESKTDGTDMDSLKNIRAAFPLLNQNPDLVYLDNASTTQKPEVVIDAISRYYREANSNVHRSVYSLAQRSSEAFSEARETVRDFLNAHSSREIIFTRGTTEALNLLAYSLGSIQLKEGDIILSTELEHHANFVPWQQLAVRTGARFMLIPADEQATLVMDFLKELDADGRGERVRIVTMGHISNAFGTVNPVQDVAMWCREHDVPLVLDAAQSVSHMTLDVQEMGVDFICFSGHKLYGPMGMGVLWGRESWLERLPPWQTGGDMIVSVKPENSTWAGLPNKFEAGTPNVEGAVGLAAAIKWFGAVGMAQVQAVEKELSGHVFELLRNLPGLQFYGQNNLDKRLGVFSFNLEKMHGHDVAEFLNSKNIAVRSGFHCAQPAMRAVGVASTCRASLGIYNSVEDIQRLVEALEESRRFFI